MRACLHISPVDVAPEQARSSAMHGEIQRDPRCQGNKHLRLEVQVFFSPDTVTCNYENCFLQNKSNIQYECFYKKKKKSV